MIGILLLDYWEGIHCDIWGKWVLTNIVLHVAYQHSLSIHGKSRMGMGLCLKKMWIVVCNGMSANITHCVSTSIGCLIAAEFLCYSHVGWSSCSVGQLELLQSTHLTCIWLYAICWSITHSDPMTFIWILGTVTGQGGPYNCYHPL